MLTTDLSLDEARVELHNLFGDDYENEIWLMCCRINDSDPEELEESKGKILEELDAKMDVERNVELETTLVEKDQATINLEKETEIESEEEYEEEEFLTQEQKFLAAWVARNYVGNTSLLGYRIFALRCKVRGFFSVPESDCSDLH